MRRPEAKHLPTSEQGNSRSLGLAGAATNKEGPPTISDIASSCSCSSSSLWASSRLLPEALQRRPLARNNELDSKIFSVFYEGTKVVTSESAPREQMRAALIITKVILVLLCASRHSAQKTYFFCPNDCGADSGHGECQVRAMWPRHVSSCLHHSL